MVLRDSGKHQRSWGALQSPRTVLKSTPYINPTSLSRWPWSVAVLTGVCILQLLSAAPWLSPAVAPGHSDVAVPQNVAWLAGFRLARQSIFMCVYFVWMGGRTADCFPIQPNARLQRKAGCGSMLRRVPSRGRMYNLC